MKNDYLYKKDALFELYSLQGIEDYFSINITHKNERGNYYGKWLEFQPELDELQIIEGGDEWLCVDEDVNEKIISREDLKVKLENKGFTVKLM